MRLLLSHILMLLTSTREDSTFTCIPCGTTSQGYHEALSHAADMHGYLLGHHYNANTIHMTLQQMHIARINHNQPVDNMCTYCYKVTGNGLTHLIHFYANHTTHSALPQYCGICFSPIQDETMIEHYNAHHSTQCHKCNTSLSHQRPPITDIKGHIDHIFACHLPELWTIIDSKTLAKLVDNATTGQYLVPWTNNFRELPSCQEGNILLPGLYSNEFQEIINALSPADSNLHKVHIPYNDLFDITVYFEQGKIRTEHIADIQKAYQNSLLQNKLNEIELEESMSLSLGHTLIFETEVAQTRDSPCTTCKDDWNHSDSPDKCIDPDFTTSRIDELFDFSLTPSHIHNHAAILVGAKTFTHVAPSEDFPILNLSCKDKHVKYTTGHVDGKPVVYSSWGNHDRHYHDYLDTVRKVVSMVGRNRCMLVFVEFFLLGAELDKRNEIYYQVLAFIAGLEKIRAVSDCQFVVLPPIRRHERFGTADRFMKLHHLNGLAANMLSLVCTKRRIPLLSLYGAVTSHGVYVLNSGAWTHHENESAEPLFNSNGSTTREFAHRVTRSLENAIRAWGHTINEISDLRRNYRWLESQNGYRYPSHIIGVESPDHGYDEVG